jgi:hypothetical protein
MPRATANRSDTKIHTLKTVPATDTEEAGFVEIRRLVYGDKLERRARTGKMSMRFEGKGKGSDAVSEMNVLDKASTLFDFQRCIVDHNLTDENNRKLNLSNQQDIDSLDPRVGEEISNAIDDLNNFEEADDSFHE